MIVLFFSSHGTPPDKFGGVHLVTYDTDVKPRERVWETSITEGILQQFVQEVRAKRMTVILDACYSNGAYSKVAGFLPPGGKSLGSGDDEGVGLSKQDMARRIFGAKDLVIDGPPAAAGAPKGIIGSGGYGECSSVPVTPESASGSPRRCTTASSHAMAAVAPVQAGTPHGRPPRRPRPRWTRAAPSSMSSRA